MSTFSSSGVIVGDSQTDHGAKAKRFGVTYQRAELTAARGWTNVPESFSPAYEQPMLALTTNAKVNPNRGFALYIYDSTDDRVVNYVHVLLVPEKPATFATPGASGAPGATPEATPFASPDASPVAAGNAVENKDGNDAVGDVAAGPGIASGKTLEGVRAIDVAPTVAYLLNIPGPTSARGKILYDALANGAALREVTILDISDFHGQLIPLPANTDSL